MRNTKLLTTMLALLFVTPAYANEPLNVFACEPEWASLAKEIGGDRVEAFSATTAQQDPHHVRAKPSLIAAMRKADMVICSGASLEVGWLPILIQKAGNEKTQPGNVGYLQVAEIVPVLDKPASIDRSLGDIHPEGNPHLQLNPHNIALAAKEVTNRLKQLDVADASAFDANYVAFAAKWDAAMARWEKEAAPLRGTKLVVHHKSFTYLLDWLGMQEAGSLEPKPGVPPTTAHLEELLQGLKANPAQAIIHTPYEPEEASLWLSEKTGTPVLILPYTIGGNAQVTNLFTLFDQTVSLLNGAAHGKQ